MRKANEALLQIGATIIAVRNIGPVKEGTPGIVTGITEERWFWKSKLIYLCTFADNVRIAARPKEVEDYDHGYSLADLENPNFLSVLSIIKGGMFVPPS